MVGWARDWSWNFYAPLRTNDGRRPVDSHSVMAIGLLGVYPYCYSLLFVVPPMCR